MKKLSSAAIVTLAAALLLCGMVTPSAAVLIDRGGGLIYDTELNITWLQDAALAKTETFGVSGIDSNGQMNWYTANEWIAAMNAANYLGYSDWRLANTAGTTFGIMHDGEMGHLYYSELGNAEWGSLTNTGPFLNLWPTFYWAGMEFSQTYAMAWDFYFGGGYEGATEMVNHFYSVLAVRDGDSSPPPDGSTPIILIPYQASDYKYQIYPHGEIPSDWGSATFDDSAYQTGTAAFGGGPSNWCQISSTVNTPWSLWSEIVLRKHFQLPQGATNVRVGIAADNDFQILINGSELTNGLTSHDGCPNRDDFTFAVPSSLLYPGDNLVAVRVRDRGDLSFADLQVIADAPPPPPPQGKLEVLPSFHGFGEAVLDSCTDVQSFTLWNRGNGDLQVTGISLSDEDNFRLTLGGWEECTSPLIPFVGFCTINVSFCPKTQVGPIYSDFKIYSNDPARLYEVPISGTALIEEADDFVFPVLALSQTDPYQNKSNPIGDGWHGNGLGASIGNKTREKGHLGQDYVPNRTKPASRTVYAVANGEVVEVLNGPGRYGWCDDRDHGWGPVVVVKHYNSTGFWVFDSSSLINSCSPEKGPKVVYSLYGHLSKASLADLYVGKRVRKGEVLGEIGKYNVDVISWETDHLHFELKDQIGFLEGRWYLSRPGECPGSAEYSCNEREIQGVGTGYSGKPNFAPHRYLPSVFIRDNQSR